MKINNLIFFFSICCSFCISAFSGNAFGDVWDEVLSQGNLKKEDIHFDELNMLQVGGAEFQIPIFKLLHGDPLRVPFFAQTYREFIFKNIEKPTDLLISGLQKIGLGIRRNLGDQDPTANEWNNSLKPGALIRIIQKIHQTSGHALSAKQMLTLAKQIEPINSEHSALMAYLLEVEINTFEWRQKAFANAIEQKRLKTYFSELLNSAKLGTEDQPQGLSPLLQSLSKGTEFNLLAVGGIDLTYAVEKVKNKIKTLSLDKPIHFEWLTPLGRIVISTENKNDTYIEQAYLLILDSTGDDTYFGGGGTYDENNPVSILIDLKGNDKYLTNLSLMDKPIGTQTERFKQNQKPSFGSGVLGYGISLDLNGNDIYRAFRQTQGQGNFGIGILWDVAGNDQYDCWVQCQGSAEFGSGMLLDNQGKDHYNIFQHGQGFGGVFGAGVLIDAGPEDDEYIANTTQIDFPAIVDPKVNTSFAQGAALGLRADYSDGNSLSGGFGALIDEGGKKNFDAGFYAQGAAYWYGVGFISVGTGSDKYHAGKYAEAASAHFGVGILHDLGGNDSYQVDRELGIGHGHDFGLGFFIDGAGDDNYNSSNFSLGCASGQGIGIFWDKAGEDSYISKTPENLGCASLRIALPNLRTASRTIGIFLDTGGKNKFETGAKNVPATTSSKSWVHEPLGLPSDFSVKAKAHLIGIGLVKEVPAQDD